MSDDLKFGLEEGETCNAYGCQGKLVLKIKNCTCFISAPCPKCTDSVPECDKCGRECRVDQDCDHSLVFHRSSKILNNEIEAYINDLNIELLMELSVDDFCTYCGMAMPEEKANIHQIINQRKIKLGY